MTPGGGGGTDTDPAANEISQLGSSLTITDTGNNGLATLSLDGTDVMKVDASKMTLAGPPGAWFSLFGDLQVNVTDEYGSSVVVDNVGNMIIIGGTSDSANNVYSSTIVKFDPAGAIIWQKEFAAADSSSNYGDCLVIDPSDNSIYAALNIGNLGAVLVKLSATGAVVWQNSLTTGGIYEMAIQPSVTTGAPGAVIVVGITADGNNTANLAKINPDGTVAFTVTIAPAPSISNITFFGVSTDSARNIYVVGKVVTPLNVAWENFVAKYDPVGRIGDIVTEKFGDAVLIHTIEGTYRRMINPGHGPAFDIAVIGGNGDVSEIKSGWDGSLAA